MEYLYLIVFIVIIYAIWIGWGFFGGGKTQMKKLLLILLLIVGCDLDKTYKCEVDVENLPTVNYDNAVKIISYPLLQVDALDIDEAEEYCYDWYELDSLTNVDNVSCNCEVFP